MFKAQIPAAALLAVALIGAAPLTASAPLSASAAVAKVVVTPAKAVEVQSMKVNMLFDGVSLQPPTGQYVFMHKNTTYVPLRFMSYALQKSVAWDAKNLKVTVSEPSAAELVQIKEYLTNAADNNIAAVTNKVKLNEIPAKYVFNGVTKTLPLGYSSYILNGTVYVPLRYLSEAVGHSISWNQQNKTITANSEAYQALPSSTPEVKPDATAKPVATQAPSATPAPSPATGGAAAGGGSGGTDKLSYETITSETEAKLTALRSQSAATLFDTALQYVAAEDDAAKASIKAKGKQQLASFTASFNSIISDAEQKLNNNGHSTAIISEYRSAFENELQNGLNSAAGLVD
ncbi:copper amine oxidase N-terminal domain-containing protein [Paenibacillus donghaensis]|uniref:Copper amine oxidase-like N-terminal domain-containing protein n=1 Tax=Paenibacillus donghaensis TaxID=414771 RepID=A0A2Z2KI74_9BACL|nr:copper amine oxidase N-terminal domain-containing protein [Paenibacillus donghaensis]ASA23815.1 hypothetical protein B9T62_25345 [Paenibacillus donghaensis]